MEKDDEQKCWEEGYKTGCKVTRNLYEESKAYRIGKLALEILDILKTDEDEE